MELETNVTNKSTKNVHSASRLVGLKKHSEELNKVVVESLEGALLNLIEKKPYEQISITELCAKAGVSRTSFYSNFNTKDEVLKKIVVELQKELGERIGSPFRQPVNLEWYKGLFKLVKERANILKPIFSAGFQNKYQELVNGVILRHNNMQQGEIYLRLLWSGGIINAVVHWLATDMIEPIDDIAAICNQHLISFNERTCIG